jgi:type II secretory pathway pseudopilin PulG
MRDRDDDEPRGNRKPPEQPQTVPRSTGSHNIVLTLLIVGCLLALSGVVCVGIGSLVVYKSMDDARDAAARLGIAKIEEAVQAYKLRHGQFPASLQELTQRNEDGTPPYLEATDLIDPWANQYSYEPQVLNTLGKPRISTFAPNGNKIANW